MHILMKIGDFGEGPTNLCLPRPIHKNNPFIIFDITIDISFKAIDDAIEKLL